MKILMSDHTFNSLIISIGCRFRLRQHILRVEHVQPFVLHRPHVEIINGDNLVLIQIVFEAVGLFIPAHGFFQ